MYKREKGDEKMDENTALRFVKAVRKEIEAITLHARVSVERGICLNSDADIGRDVDDEWDLAVNVVHFSGWPTSKNDPEKFAFAEVPLSHPLLAPLRDRTLPVVMWSGISRLPLYVCRMAAEVLDGQQFKVRLVATDQELAGVIRCEPSYNDVGEWDIRGIFYNLEAWNQNGEIEILLLERQLGEVFTEEILDRLKRAVAQQ